MPYLQASAHALLIMQLLTSLLLAILFLQSGLDKVFDRKGNVEWLTSHFSKTFMSGTVPLLVTAITLLELAAGVLSAIGFVMIALRRDVSIAFDGAAVSGLSLVALFFGQRLAKDYAGAAVLIPYFILTLIAMFLFA